MSKITLEPNSSGAGTFSIVSPDSNTNRTLTLPNENGLILTDISSISTSNLSGTVDNSNLPIISKDKIPVGVIVGVASFITDQHTTRNGNDDSTGVTPISGLTNLSYDLTSLSNKLIITFNINWSGGGGNTATSFIKIRDNGTNIITSDAILAQSSNMPNGSDRVRGEQMNGTFEYTPNSPSVSLEVRFGAPISGGDITINGDYQDSTSGKNLHSSLTIFEVQT